MKYFSLILPLFVLFSANIYAQEGNNWFIGDNYMVNFNCPPFIETETFPNADVEKAAAGASCTSMSDTAGNLLFFATCRSMYNRQNKMMPHGKDSLQTIGILYGQGINNSIFCVPDPGNNNRYYVFFTDIYNPNLWDPYDLNYAIVDMSLDNGLGDVVSVKRHIIQHVQCLGATRHKNKRDFWLATVENSDVLINSRYYIDSFVIFHVGPSGIQYHKIPVGASIKQTPLLYFSNDGRKMAVFEETGSFFYLYDFDKNTGLLSHAVHIQEPPALEAVAFSPDGTKLYGFYTGGPQPAINQYGITPGNDSAAIAKSNTTITTGGIFSDLRLGPDGRIYNINFYSPYLGAIEKPDQPGTACQFNPKVNMNIDINTPGQNVQLSQFFPLFVTRRPVVMPYDISGYCANAPVTFTPFQNVHSPSFHWDFGDPASGMADTSTARTGIHLYKTPGRYRVTLVANNTDSITDTFSRFVCISAAPQPVKMDTNLCKGEQTTLNAGNPGAHYLWNTGDTTQMITVAPGTYWANVTNGSCTITDTAHVANASTASIHLGKDTTIRQGTGLILRSGYPTANWSTGATGDSIVVFAAGTYWATLKGDKCTVTDTIVVKTYKSGIEPTITTSFGMLLVPNPSSANTLIKFNAAEGGNYILTVTDLTGKEVFRHIITANTGDNAYNMDITNLKTGAYIITLQNNGAAEQVRFLKE